MIFSSTERVAPQDIPTGDIPATTLTESSNSEVVSDSSPTLASPVVQCSSSAFVADDADNSIDPEVQSGDFGRIVALKTNRQLTPDEKYYLLKHHFVPDKNYNFPVHSTGNHNRKFQIKWLDEYNGLVYSITDDGGYCKFCVLFGNCDPSQELSVLVKRPLDNLKKAKQKLNDHFSTREPKNHQAAVEKAMTFCSVQEKKIVPIDQQISSRRAKLIRENRLKLQSITATVIFCGRQGLAFRGHAEDGPFDVTDNSINRGNFQSLLRFRVDAGDVVLKKHLETADRNAIYISKEIQNQMIVICGDVIRNKILQKIREAKFFSIIADEATDSANDEQLSISIRFLDNNVPQEKFLGFHECLSGVSGEAIANNIITQLANWQLDPHMLRGQAFDGAGAMAGRSRGASSRILSIYPKALYTHCAAHRLNLCVVKCCSLREVNNMMEIADKTARFFSNSPKRQLSLESWIHETLLEEEKRKKLKQMCRTRWIERHEAFEVFIDLFLPIVCSLEDISCGSGWNRESRSDAQSLLLALSQFQFIVTLKVTQSVLAYTRALSVKLQGRYSDIVRAYREVDNVKSTVRDLRSNVDTFHARVYDEAKKLAEVVHVDESIPRLASRQQHRSNVSADNYPQYYCRNLTIPLLDHLITQLNTRFDKTDSVVEFMQLLPSVIIISNEFLRPQNFEHILELYKDICTPEKSLVHADCDFFPNIHTLLCIMGTLPVTSCECERSISMLKLIKTSLRSSMGQDRLNGLAMLYYHRDIAITSEEVVDEFSRRHPRRMAL